MKLPKRPPFHKISLLAVALSGLQACSTIDSDEQVQLGSLALPAKYNFLVVDEKLCTLDPETQQSYEVAQLGNLWPRLRSGYQLPVVENPRVNTYLDWYSRHPHYMDRVIERGQPYLYYIVSQLEAENMPLELALLPIVESAFDPFAYSHGQASGIWQFVPATGRHYGLKQNWWYDGRRDLVASTDAAIRYLKRLHVLFDGDWLLALAAYNTGEGNLGKAIRRNERQGKPTDFWSLKLPRETRAYVPQLLALSQVIADPQAYNISLRAVPDEPYFAQIDIKSQIDLAQAAELAGMDIEQLYMLNAGYNRWATDPEGPHQLLVPLTHSERLTERLSGVENQQRVSWKRHEVISGDTLISIAQRYHTSVDTIQSVNDLRGHIIRAGQALMIPTRSQPADHYAYSADQRLLRKQDQSQGSDGSKKIEHQVRRGDSFWKIARKHGVSVSALTRWNAMAPGDKLRPGQTLVIWSNNNDELAQTQAPSVNSRSTVRKVNYRVRSGDSIAAIANRFNLNVKDILDWNQVSGNSYIHPGQSLTLFVNVTGN